MVVALGGGTRVTRVLNAISLAEAELPVYSFRHCSLPKLWARREIRFFDDEVLEQFARARGELSSERQEQRDFPLEGVDQADHAERRFEFVPYALIAQLLIATPRGRD